MTIRDKIISTDRAIHEGLLDKLSKKIDERLAKESSLKKKDERHIQESSLTKKEKELAITIKELLDGNFTTHILEKEVPGCNKRWKSEINRIEGETPRKKILIELLDELIKESN